MTYRDKLRAAISAEWAKLSAQDLRAIEQALGNYLDTEAGSVGFMCRARGGMTRWRSAVASNAGQDAFRAGYLAGREDAILSLRAHSSDYTIGAIAKFLAAIAERPLDPLAEEPERRKRIGRAAVELTRLLADEWLGEVLK